MIYTIEQIEAFTLESDYEGFPLSEVIESKLYNDYLTTGPDPIVEIDAIGFTSEELETKLTEFKEELIIISTEYFRVADLQDRYDNCEHFNAAVIELYSIANSAYFFQYDILSNTNHDEAETIMASIEASAAEIKVSCDKQKLREIKISQGEAYRNVSKRVLNLIAGHNLSGGLTIEQIDQMEITFADIKDALNNSRPDKAYALIIAATPDGVIVTEELKAEIIEELKILNT